MADCIRKKIELYAFRYIRELLQEEMTDAVNLEETQKNSLNDQIEMLLPKISAIVRLAYEAGWNEGYDDAEEREDKIRAEVNQMLESSSPEAKA